MTKALQCKVKRMERLAEKAPIEKDLIDLACQYLPEKIQLNDRVQVEALSGDASFRSYYRLTTTPSVLGVSASPDNEDWVSFLRVCNLLESLNVRVPVIYAADLTAGKLLIEDLGEGLYQDALIEADDNHLADKLYSAALNTLYKIAGCEERPAWLPRYTDGLLRQEMELFPFWFVNKLLGYSIDTEESRLINACFNYLVNQALDQPQVLVHRDFHCRNLLPLQTEEPGVIDFQDAVWGPITYDLASLSRDYYVRWKPQRVIDTREGFAARLFNDNKLSQADLGRFSGWFEATSAQRHLKVLGIFARLAIRDNKKSYLASLPLALRYLMESCEKDEQLKDLSDWVESALMPHIEKQDWYSDWHQAGDEITVW